MTYNLLLIEADPSKTLGGSCLNDLKNFLNYCRLVIGCDQINMVYVLTNNELSKKNKTSFCIPTKKTAITFIHFSLEKNLIDVAEYFKKHPNPMIIYISGHGGQIKDINGDEIDGLDEFIPINGNHIITDDKLTQLLVSQDKMVICIVDTCHSGSMIDLNYIYDGDKFKLNRLNMVADTNAFYIGACSDEQYAYCDTGEEVGYGGAFTIQLIEQRLLNEFLRDPTIENITKAYDGIEYFLRFHGQTPTIQTNFLDKDHSQRIRKVTEPVFLTHKESQPLHSASAQATLN